MSITGGGVQQLCTMFLGHGATGMQLRVDDLNAVVNAVCDATTPAWCYISHGDRTVSHSSLAFRQMWQLDRHSVVDFADPFLLQRFAEAGIPDCWTRQVLDSHANHSNDADRVYKFTGCVGTTRVFLRPVSIDNGELVGWLFMFERESASTLDTATIQKMKDTQNRISGLSSRETEILELVYDGLTSKAIAQHKNISEKTVEKHRSRVMRKLGVPNAIGLIRCVSEARFADVVLMSDGY